MIFNIHLKEKLCKLGIEGNFLNLIKYIYNEPTVNITLILNYWTSYKGGARQWCPLITYSQHCTEGSSQCNYTRKQRHELESSKTVFTNNIIIYVESLK